MSVAQDIVSSGYYRQNTAAVTLCFSSFYGTDTVVRLHFPDGKTVE